MIKVLVINEPFVPGFCRTQRWAARTRGRVLRPPDWLAYATAVLLKDGIQARLFDFPALGWKKDDIPGLIRKERPDFVVMDSTTPSVFSDIECCKMVKENSRAVVIMVGPHISALPEETLNHAAGVVDVGCVGEYDYSVRDVVRNYPDLARVPGIVFRQNGRTQRTSPRPHVENLDELPFPAWEQLDNTRYFDGGKLYPYMDIISGRGCPNTCSFCLWPQVMHGTRYRLRSPENVVDEIVHDIRLFPEILQGEFFFEDDTFTVDKHRAMRICEEILRRNLTITFSVNARADSADPELFRFLKKAGCRMLLVGFESGNQKILDGVNKRITLEHSRRFTALAREAGLGTHGCFVIGLPGETPETAKETIRFALDLGLQTVQFSGAVPFPGTRFFDLAKQEGWLKTEKWDQWLDSGEQKGIVEYPHITKKQINYFVDRGLKKFYFRPEFMLNFLLSTRSVNDLYRKVKGGWNFLSYLFGKSDD